MRWIAYGRIERNIGPFAQNRLWLGIFWSILLKQCEVRMRVNTVGPNLLLLSCLLFIGTPSIAVDPAAKPKNSRTTPGRKVPVRQNKVVNQQTTATAPATSPSNPTWLRYCEAGLELVKRSKPAEAEKYFQAALEGVEKQVIQSSQQPPKDARRATYALVKVLNFHAKEIVKMAPTPAEAQDVKKVQEYSDGQKKHMEIAKRAHADIAKLQPREGQRMARSVELATDAMKKVDDRLNQLKKEQKQQSGQPSG